MKRNGKRSGVKPVFCFTLRQQVIRRGWRAATGIGLLLCFLLPVGIMALAAALSGPESGPTDQFAVPEQVYVVGDLSAERLQSVLPEPFDTVQCIASDVEDGRAAAAAQPYALLLLAERGEENVLRVLRPADSGLTEDDAELFGSVIRMLTPLLMQPDGLTPAQQAVLLDGISIRTEVLLPSAEPDAEPDDGTETAREVLKMVLPYLTVMALYFLVLFYGQSVANSAIMEKTSKLMDTFLLAVRPAGMLTGKVLAIALCGMMQVILWLAGLIGGFAAGAAVAEAIRPKAPLGVVTLLRSMGQMTDGLFSVTGIVLAALLLASGFLLYCALAALGGALAGKPEDLSSTNMLFTLALVASLYLTLFGGNGVISDAQWLNWVPFTAVLITPGRALLGDVSLAVGLGSLAIVVITALLLLELAGRLYTAMAFYKGNPPSIGQIGKLLRRRSR